MAWKKEVFGTLPDGSTAERYTLTSDGGAKAVFTNLGAIWLEMLVPDRDGNLADVVLGYDTVEKCMSYPGHMGEPVGRNANRIGGASFQLNGVTYQLEVNSGDKNNLHSGPNYYRDRLWDTAVEESSLGTRITFSLFSPDGDQGYPGNANIAVIYTLTPDNGLQIDYRMVADADTIANFTNHAYFNLAGHDSGSAMEQLVWIDADFFTVADESSIPTGELVSVLGNPMDFTTKKPISQNIDDDFEALAFAGGYDHNWVLNHPPGELSLVATAEDPKSGRFMEIYTDLPGIQFYTANFLSGDYEAKAGARYGGRHGYCFETQHFPDAINKPQFPSPVLEAGEEYHTTTIYRFITV